MQGTGPAAHDGRRPARRSDRRVLRVGLSLSAAIHAVLLAVVSFPRPDAGIGTGGDWGLREVEVPPRVEVPPPPGPIGRPSPPVVSAVEVAEPASRPGGGPDPPVVLAEPVSPPLTAASRGRRPAVAPPEVAPSLEAPDHFRRRLERSYTRLLRARGAGGTVELRFFVDPRGRVSRVRVERSSGHASLDRVARRLAGEMQFLPALNRDRAVGVWVSQRICFVATDGGADEPPARECRHRVVLGGR